MNVSHARDVMATHATLLLLDVPVQTQLGLDLFALTTGRKFRGIKFIPPGAHYLYYHPPSSSSSSAAVVQDADTAVSLNSPVCARVGRFLWLAPGDIHVLRWDAAAEDLVSMHDDDNDVDQVERLREGVRRFEFDQGLGPYPTDQLAAWRRLVSFVTPDIIHRLQRRRSRANATASPSTSTTTTRSTPTRSTPATSTPSSSSSSSSTTTTTAPFTFVDVSQLTTAERRRMKSQSAFSALSTDSLMTQQLLAQTRYTLVPSIGSLQHTTAATITAMHTDKSHLLHTMLRQIEQDSKRGAAVTASSASSSSSSSSSSPSTLAFRSLLGQVQHAFVDFCMGESLEGYEYWKSVVMLLSACDTAIDEEHAGFESLIDMLTSQVQQLPEDFFIDPISANNFVERALRDLLTIVHESDGLPASLLRASNTLENVLRSRFGVHFDLVDEQLAYAAVVVDDDDVHTVDDDRVYASVATDDRFRSHAAAVASGDVAFADAVVKRETAVAATATSSSSSMSSSVSRREHYAAEVVELDDDDDEDEQVGVGATAMATAAAVATDDNDRNDEQRNVEALHAALHTMDVK